MRLEWIDDICIFGVEHILYEMRYCSDVCSVGGVTSCDIVIRSRKPRELQRKYSVCKEIQLKSQTLNVCS